MFFVQSLRHPAQNLREDYAGVATRSQQGPVRYFSSDGSSRSFVAIDDIANGGLHGGRHVGAGISIRNGKDVQSVNGVAVFL